MWKYAALIVALAGVLVISAVAGVEAGPDKSRVVLSDTFKP